MTRIFRLSLLVCAIALPGCSSDDTPIGPDPTPVPTVTEEFDGELNRNGGRTHNFAVGANGTVSATLTTLAPDSEMEIGFSMGTWNTSACAIVIANDKAKQGTVVNGQVNSFGGNVCVRIYDVGNITENVTYKITVVHP
jgi:uncharacterized protein YceK